MSGGVRTLENDARCTTMSAVRFSEFTEFAWHLQKRGTTVDANTTAQPLVSFGELTLSTPGVAWQLHLWIECVTETAVSMAYYVAARSRSGAQAPSIVTRYNVTSAASVAPTPIATLNVAGNAVSVTTQAATVADGAVSYIVRLEYRTFDIAATIAPPTIN